MNPEADNSRYSRGQFALTRLFPGGRGASSPEGVLFPARVPRKGEAFFAMAFCYALAAAALVVVFPATFAGTGAFWMLLVVPALVQMEVFAAAALHALTAPTINGRVWFAAVQVATCMVAATEPGWPRAIAIVAVVLTVAELAARGTSRSAC
ncbi:MAG: hypothetical protein ACKO2G_11305 [Verrucomicrobiales bacterium]